MSEEKLEQPEEQQEQVEEQQQQQQPSAKQQTEEQASVPQQEQKNEQIMEKLLPKFIKAEVGEMTEVESMCTQCEENGITRMMFTKIPHFREIIVSSFECGNPECGETNREVQFGGTYGAKRVVYELSIETEDDLRRQVVKSDYATIKIPEVDLEIPPESQKGTLNTVEGVIQQVAQGLRLQQPVRRISAPEEAAKIDEFCAKIDACLELKMKWSLQLDDPSGNSYIEHIHSTNDTRLQKREFVRTLEERQQLGLAVDGVYNTERTEEEQEQVEAGRMETHEDEILELDEKCSACTKPGVVRMHKTDIPHFKETLIMAFVCDYCGYKSTEVKSGGGIKDKGKKITLKVRNPRDLSRDLLKSDSATLKVPELDLELADGTLGGMFTTVEGVLTQVKTQLENTPNVFGVGDSGAVDSLQVQEKDRFGKFFVALDKCIAVEVEFTLVLDDPLGNIYIEELTEAGQQDPQVITEEYTRTWDQDEDLGLHDMKV